MLGRRDRKEDILQVGNEKGEKKNTGNIGKSKEQFLAQLGSVKGDARAVRVGGSTILALSPLGTERPDCGERGMCVSGRGDPET